jgi:hypothetical protein
MILLLVILRVIENIKDVLRAAKPHGSVAHRAYHYDPLAAP